MTEQGDCIPEFLSSTLTPGNTMVDLSTLVVLEVQPISPPFPALLLQEFAFPSIEQWMPAQTLTSRREVAVIGAGRSFLFDVVPNMGAIV